MTDVASGDANIQTALLDAVCDALTAAFIVYDKNDTILFASRHVLNHYPLSTSFLKPGTRLRDLLGAMYDCSGERLTFVAGNAGRMPSREEWITERIATHWKERSERVERHSADRWVQLAKRRLPNGFGVCVIKDISETKKREDQWRADLERVQLTEEILDNLPFPIFVKDRNFCHVAVNQAFCTLIEAEAEMILGRTAFEIVAPDVAHSFDLTDRQVMETGEPMTIRERIVQAEGHEIQIITRKQRVGKPGRYFLVSAMENLSDVALAEPPPMIGEDEQATADRRPGASDPIDAIAAMTERAKPQRFAGRKLLLVAADMAVEAAASKTLLKMGFEACSVSDAHEQEAFLDVAETVGVKIDLILIDRQMDVKCQEMAKHHGIDVLVLDACQLNTELARRVTQHFDWRERTQTSVAGNAAWEITQERVSESPGDAMPLDVLVAEDNAINQIVFSQILEGLGYSYQVVASGDEAVRVWQERAPAVVLMDITLPVMNGFEAARAIRALEQPGQDATPIIGVLAQAFDHDNAECLKAGMNDVILKPISPDMIETVFQRFMRVKAVRRAI